MITEIKITLLASQTSHAVSVHMYVQRRGEGEVILLQRGEKNKWENGKAAQT